MDFNIESIVSLAGLLLGGSGLGAFFTWRYMPREAKARAETEEGNMAQKVQETYDKILEAKDKEVDDNHRLIDELRADRDHYKSDRDELRDQVRRLMTEMDALKYTQARQGRQIEMMRPFLCSDLSCKRRQRVVLGEIEEKGEENESE